MRTEYPSEFVTLRWTVQSHSSSAHPMPQSLPVMGGAVGGTNPRLQLFVEQDSFHGCVFSTSTIKSLVATDRFLDCFIIGLFGGRVLLVGLLAKTLVD